MPKPIIKQLFFLLLLIAVFIYGLGVGTYHWFPYDILKKIKNSLPSLEYQFNEYGLLSHSSSHQFIACPKQTKDVGVIFAFGQSNSANSSEYRYSEEELDGVINYYNGNCYKAKSPLLGASGSGGEWISKTAKNLIVKGDYKQVVVVSTGVSGSPITRWAEGNDLNDLLISVLTTVQKQYEVTELLWHQGESDRFYTFTETYMDMFLSMKKTIRDTGVDAPIFISIASVCDYGEWVYPNRVSRAQKSLSLLDNVYLGVNTDELVPLENRFDGCHFNKKGQESASLEMANSISRYKARHK